MFILILIFSSNVFQQILSMLLPPLIRRMIFKKCMLFIFRPRKVVPCPNKQFVKGEDPYLNDSVTDNIFPQLGERSRIGTHQQGGNNPSLQIITLREGDKSVSLPALSVEQNFPQMLSELVMHI